MEYQQNAKKNGGRAMKEYEVVQEITNACGGSNVPQTSITEMQLDDIEAYVKSKHPKDFDRAVKEELEDGGVKYTLALGAVTYKYVFNEI